MPDVVVHVGYVEPVRAINLGVISMELHPFEGDHFLATNRDRWQDFSETPDRDRIGTMTDPQSLRRQDQVLGELKTIRASRIWNRPSQLPVLSEIARVVGSDESVSTSALIPRTIEAAAGRLDPAVGKALLLLLGVSPQTAGKTADLRYDQAAVVLLMEGSTLRRYHANRYLEDLANELVGLEREAVKTTAALGEQALPESAVERPTAESNDESESQVGVPADVVTPDPDAGTPTSPSPSPLGGIQIAESESLTQR